MWGGGGHSHLFCHEATALQLGLGLVPGPGDAALSLRVIVTEVSDHLRSDRVLHLLTEDVGQHPAHYRHHEQQEHEDGVGEEETFDLFVPGWKV